MLRLAQPFHRALKNSALPSTLLHHFEFLSPYGCDKPRHQVHIPKNDQKGKRPSHEKPWSFYLVWNRMPLPSKLFLTSLLPEVGHLSTLGPSLANRTHHNWLNPQGLGEASLPSDRVISTHSLSMKVAQWL